MVMANMMGILIKAIISVALKGVKLQLLLGINESSTQTNIIKYVIRVHPVNKYTKPYEREYIS